MLAIDHLTVGYGDGVVLADVSLVVEPGQVVCLIGRNGVGKTTLLRAVMGLLRPRGGVIRIGGVDVTGWPPHRRARAGLGYVPQGRMIFPHLTVRENLLIGLEAAAGKDTALLTTAFTLFPRLAQLAERSGGKLSGGEQQQLAIARALVAQPRILLLDEPTEGIQPSIVEEIAAALREIRDHGTVAILMAEQFLDFAGDLADYYCVLEGGTVAVSGPAAALGHERVREYLSL
ncbi:MAG: urea ABC transporter ATP-binding subunit UrtE [Chloroflexi bacterium]|nr:urea ABC transporter ATP-binding subunit UrtE [Chloroflexota bacterium]